MSHENEYVTEWAEFVDEQVAEHGTERSSSGTEWQNEFN